MNGVTTRDNHHCRSNNEKRGDAKNDCVSQDNSSPHTWRDNNVSTKGEYSGNKCWYDGRAAKSHAILTVCDFLHKTAAAGNIRQFAARFWVTWSGEL
jgi:hypothetical protein